MSVSNAIAIKGGKEAPYVMGRIFAKNKAKGNHSLYASRKFMSGPYMKLFDREIIGDRRFDERFTNGEDSLFVYKVSDRIEGVEFTSEDAIYYRCYRSDSLFMRKRPFSKRLTNSIKLIEEYTKIYFSKPLKYNLLIYLSRIAGALHSAISDN